MFTLECDRLYYSPSPDLSLFQTSNTRAIPTAYPLLECLLISQQSSPSEVCFDCFLECPYGGRLKSEIRLEILCDFPDKALEREFTNQELSRFLVAADFAQSDCARAVTMGFLDAAGSESG